METHNFTQRRIVIKISWLQKLSISKNLVEQTFSIFCCQFLRAGNKIFYAISVNKLQNAAGLAGEADAEDGADIGFGDGVDDAFVVAVEGFDGLAK